MSSITNPLLLSTTRIIPKAFLQRIIFGLTFIFLSAALVSGIVFRGKVMAWWGVHNNSGIAQLSRTIEATTPSPTNFTPTPETGLEINEQLQKLQIFSNQLASRLDTQEKALALQQEESTSLKNAVQATVQQLRITNTLLEKDPTVSPIPLLNSTDNPSASGGGTQTSPSPGAGKLESTSNEKININNATAAELERLPGIGAAYAERIIAYRTKNGQFKSIEEIMRVSGIKEHLFQRFKTLISIGSG